jgi:hypothetical protein
MDCMDAGFQNSKSVTKDCCHYRIGKSAQRKQCSDFFEENATTLQASYLYSIYSTSISAS